MASPAMRRLLTELNRNTDNAGLVPVKITSIAQLEEALLAADTANDNSLVIIGDSRGLRNAAGAGGSWTTNGEIVCANLMLGQKFNIVGILARSGDITTQIAARVPLAITLAKTLVIYAGTNDIVTADTASTIYNRIVDTIISPGIRAGMNVVYVTLIPVIGWTVAQVAKANEVNNYMRDLLAIAPHFWLIDTAGRNTDSTTGTFIANNTVDNTHNNDRGGGAGGRDAAIVLDKIPIKASSILSGTGFDPRMISANPRMVGNNASGTNKYTNGANITGQGPTSSGWLTSNALTTGVASSVARTDGLAGAAAQMVASYGADDHLISFSPFPNGGASSIDITRTWQAATARTFGELCIPSTGVRTVQWKCITYPGGNSGGVEPVWPANPVPGDTIVDGAITLLAVNDPIGRWYETTFDFTFSAITGSICPTGRFYVDDAGFSGTLRPSVWFNGIAQIYNANTVLSPFFTAGQPIWDSSVYELNKIYRLKTQPCLVPASTRFIAPQLRIVGKNATTFTMQALAAETREVTPPYMFT